MNAFELGVIIGEPTGISYRQFLSSSQALDLAVGWSTKHDNFDLHGSYLFHTRSDIRLNGQRLPFYYGPGGRLKFDKDDIIIGFKVPLGLYYPFKKFPFSAFIEISPGLNITPDTDFDIMGGIGFRYIFSSSNAPKKGKDNYDPSERRSR